MAKEFKTNVGGTWRTINTPYAKVAGVWRTCSEVWTKVSGTWKQVYPVSPLATFYVFGGSYNGGEQSGEAAGIANTMISFGVYGGYGGSSNYRNSCYTFNCINGGFFRVNGILIGSTLTLVHWQNGMGFANYACCSGPNGYCGYVATYGRTTVALTLWQN